MMPVFEPVAWFYQHKVTGEYVFSNNWDAECIERGWVIENLHSHEQLTSAYEQGKRDAAEWISVNDRLPEPYKDVLVWPYPSEQTMVAQYGRLNGWEYGVYETNFGWITEKCNPTHWQPLPQPPAAAQKGEV